MTRSIDPGTGHAPVPVPRGGSPNEKRFQGGRGHGNRLRGPFNARVLGLLDDTMDRIYGERKRRMFASLPHHLVEIGPGAGANFRYYPPGAAVTAIEPNPHMYDRLRAAAKRYRIDLDIRPTPAEQLDLAGDSVDAVVGTFVLCTVRDPRGVIAEIRRVLREGGLFMFLEHVAAPPNTATRIVQQMIRWPWRWCFEGCNTNRETWRTLETAGFDALEITHFRLHSPLVHLAPHIAGTAVK